MPKEIEKKGAEFKAGMFIISILIILIFSILWLRYFSVEPAMSIKARFTNPGPVSKGLQTYYQGVSIGKVSKIEFSDDYKYTLVYIDIFHRDLKIPANVHAEVKTEGITGQKYIDIVYPDNPSANLLADNQVISGKSPFGLAEIQNFFEEQIKSGKMQEILSKAERTLDFTYSTSIRINNMSKNADEILTANKAEINKFLKDSSKAAANLSKVMENVDNIISDPVTEKDIKSTISSTSSITKNINQLFGDKEFQNNLKETGKNIRQISSSVNTITSDTETINGLKSTFGGLGSLLGYTTTMQGSESGGAASSNTANPLSGVGSLLGNLNKLISNLNNYSSQIFNNINDTDLITNMSNTFSKTSIILDKTNTYIDNTGNTGANQNLLTAITSAASNHSQAMKRFNCVNCGLSDMLSQRFLLIKLLFGKPGKALEKCQDSKTCPANQIILPENNPCPVLRK